MCSDTFTFIFLHYCTLALLSVSLSLSLFQFLPFELIDVRDKVGAMADNDVDYDCALKNDDDCVVCRL